MKPVLHHSYLSWGPAQSNWIGNCAGVYWHSKLREEIKRLEKPTQKAGEYSQEHSAGKTTRLFDLYPDY